MGNNAAVSSVGSAGEVRHIAEATALRVLRDLEANGNSPEALRNAILTVTRAGEELIAEAKADAARLLRETAAMAERLTEESRAATAHAEREIAQRWEQIGRERKKLDREIAEWKAAATATPARSSQDQNELLSRISAEREQLALERELFDRRAREWETAAAAQREAISREAREEAEHALDASTQRLADLTREEEHLRRRIGEHRYELVSLLRSALSELEPLDLSAAPQSEAGDLSSALTSRVSPGA
jgi:hypothetical protein